MNTTTKTWLIIAGFFTVIIAITVELTKVMHSV